MKSQPLPNQNQGTIMFGPCLEFSKFPWQLIQGKITHAHSNQEYYKNHLDGTHHI